MAGGGGLTGNPNTSIFGGDNNNALGQSPVLYDPLGNPMYGDASDYGQYGIDERERKRREGILRALNGAAGIAGGGQQQVQQMPRPGAPPAMDRVSAGRPLEAGYPELPTPILMQLLLGRSG